MDVILCFIVLQINNYDISSARATVYACKESYLHNSHTKTILLLLCLHTVMCQYVKKIWVLSALNATATSTRTLHPLRFFVTRLNVSGRLWLVMVLVLKVFHLRATSRALRWALLL